MTKNRRVRRAAENVIMICLALFILLSGWKIYSILKNYDENRDVYEKVAEEVQADGFTGDIDFDALREINPDVIGWIHYEGTVIDYPVVQGEDNDKYLHTRFDGTYGEFGTLFADANTERPFRQFNTIVYGHHMKDGSMFAGLKKLKDRSYCEKHPQLELITPEGKFHLVIWAFLNQPSESEVYATNIYDPDERQAYLDMVRDCSEYTTDINVSVNDRIVVLSTCAYEYKNARYMTVCRMVPWDGQDIEMENDAEEVYE